MKKTQIYTMSDKEHKYHTVCQRIQDGILSRTEGAEQLNMSYRNMLRVFNKYIHGGIPALAHKARGTPSNRRYPDTFTSQVRTLVQTHYLGYSASYACELLQEEHQIRIARSTLLRWLKTEPYYTPPKKRTPAYRSHRLRFPHFGRFIQGDGSFFHWFGEQYHPCCLLVLIDDATNTIMVRFSPQEYVQDILLLLKTWIGAFGIPHTLYFDRRNAYVSSPHSARYLPRVCDSLGIQIINANTPQAKGRVERVNRTLQDRLAKDLQRMGITSIEEANHYLYTKFLSRFNAKVSLPPRDAHVPVVPGYDLDIIFARHTLRTVRNDWTISFNDACYQIEKSSATMVKPRAKICVAQFLNGDFALYYNRQKLLFKEVSS